ncbi:MAG: CoB--CoM heterodisulfide reductase iron-sulfur subunit B family protein [bacterium]
MEENLRFAYYPGCSAHSTSKEYDSSFRFIFDKLEIELVDINDWVCCGASAGHFYDRKMSISLAVDTIKKGKELGLPIITVCPACYSRLIHANFMLSSDRELRKKISDVVGFDYDGTHPVLNALDVLSKVDTDKIKNSVQRPLTGLRVACYYGCLFARPPKLTNCNRYEDPIIMEGLLSIAGASPISFNYKMNCCGGSLSLSNPEIVGKMVSEIIVDAEKNGAQVIATVCPLCQTTLELRQKEASKYVGRKLNTPITFFTQLLAYSFGADEKTVGFKRNWISPEKLIKNLKTEKVEAV